jgi:hypothetical protein
MKNNRGKPKLGITDCIRRLMGSRGDPPILVDARGGPANLSGARGDPPVINNNREGPLIKWLIFTVFVGFYQPKWGGVCPKSMIN